MTIKELSKYRKIKVEIKQLEDTVKELENTIVGSSKINDMSVNKTNNNISQTEKIGIKLVQLKQKIEYKKELLLDEAHRIEDFLANVEDEEIRIIIRERFLESKTWYDVSKKIVSDRTTPYYKLQKYLKGKRKDETVAEDEEDYFIIQVK